MVQLVDSDIQTREVLEWKGLHLLNNPMAACSKKVRVFLNIKGVEWTSHVIDIKNAENYSEWFLGINPRGLIPTLVDDGVVHIESNDILMYLEGKFPKPSLVSAGGETEMRELLAFEDSLHFDLRTLVFKFFFPGETPSKPPEVIQQYKTTGSGTVGGVLDPDKDAQVNFWEAVSREGIPDASAKRSALKFRAAFDEFEAALANGPYLQGDNLSLLDIAWFIYKDRLSLAGYPFAELHPRIETWFVRLSERPEFAQEIVTPPPMLEVIAAARSEQEAAGKTLSQIAGFG